MSDDASQVDRFGQIADEFIAKLRDGQHPSIEEYADQHPDYAEEIRDVLPALVLMEKVKSYDEQDQAEGESVDDFKMLGRELGDYRIVREVGRGGMGVVFEAEQISLGRRVALKVLPHQLLADEKQRNRFEREAKAAARLHHTNIVPVFGVGSHDGLSFYVMQFIHGLGLDDVLIELKRLHFEQDARSKEPKGDGNASPKNDSAVEAVARALLSGEHPGGGISDGREPPDAVAPVGESGVTANGESATDGLVSDMFSISGSSVSSLVGADSSHDSSSGKEAYYKSVARIGVQTADALQYAHHQGITHRDVKPSNLLLDLQGTVWVTDFGLAKTDDQQNITHTGDILGTLRYMPPEAFDGRSDARSDVYALGLTLYELITLQPAFEDSDRRQLVRKVTDGAPTPMGRLDRHVPRDLATIVHKAIERGPEHRYQSAADLRDDLNRFINDEAILARQTPLLERLSRWSRRNQGLAASLAGILALLLVIAVGATLTAAYFRQQEEIQRGLTQQTGRLAENNERLLEEKQAALDQALQSADDLDAARRRAEEQEQLTRRNLYFAQMLTANQVLDQHRGLARTQSLLDRWRPVAGERDLRGWEWYYINSLCHREQFSLAGHTDAVTGIAWSPDGTLVASASRDGTVRVWSVAAQTEQVVLTSSFQQAYCAAWDSNSDRLAVGSDDGLIVWDVETGEVLHQSVQDRKVYGVSWNADDSRLAAAIKRQGSQPGEVHVIDTASWQPDREIRPTAIGDYNTTISWNPGGGLLAIPNGKKIAIWRIEDAKRLRLLQGHTALVQGVGFNPNGKGYLASASRDATIRIWDLISGDVESILEGHTHSIASLAWNPDGNRIASAGWDGTARIWDSVAGREETQFNAHPWHCFAIAWSPDGKMLATAGDDNRIKFWDTQQQSRYQQLPAGTMGPVDFVRFSDDGKRLCSGGQTAELLLWDAESGERIRSLSGGTVGWVSAAFGPNGSRLASVGGDNRVRVFDVESGELLRGLEGSNRYVDWAAGGQRIAAAGMNGRITIWNAETGENWSSLGDDDLTTQCLSWSPDGGQLASADATNVVYLWDPNSGESRRLTGHTSDVRDLAWNSIGTHLATGGADHTVRIWNIANGEVECVLEGHNEVVTSVDWGKNDERLLSADSRGTLILWDPQSQQETLLLQGPVGEARSARWSSDGRRIASTNNTRVLIWDATLGFAAEAVNESRYGMEPNTLQ